MRSLPALHRTTTLAILAGLCAFACQEGGVTSLSTESGAPANGGSTSNGTGSAEGTDDPATTANGGLSPSDTPATGPTGTGTPDNANSAQPAVTGNANGANVPVTTNPNAAPATPAQTSVPPDWSQFRYAFSTPVYGAEGAVNTGGLDLYLTNNATFCVADANGSMVDNTLTQGDSYLAISFAPPSASADASAYNGQGDYGQKRLRLRTLVADANNAGFCKIADDSAVYNGNVVIVSDANNVVKFTVQAKLPTVTTNLITGNKTTSLKSVNYQLVSTPCSFNYLFTTQSSSPGAYNAGSPASLYEAKCQTGSQVGANKSLRLP